MVRMLHVFAVLLLTGLPVIRSKKEHGFFDAMSGMTATIVNPIKKMNMGTGTRNICGRPGKGGERCTPFGKFNKMEMAMNVLFINCCRLCPASFSNKLALLQLPLSVHNQVQARFDHVLHQRKINRAVSSSSSSASASASSATHNPKTPTPLPTASFLETKHHTRQRGKLKHALKSTTTFSALTNMLYADGDAITEALPCCNVCPEQFYSPMDYDDISDPVAADSSDSAFLEVQNALQHKTTTTTTTTGRSSSKSRKGGDSSGGDAKGGSGPKGGEQWATGAVAGMAMAAGVLNTGYNVHACCNICPEEKFPNRYISAAFKGTDKEATAAFVEIMVHKNGQTSTSAEKQTGKMKAAFLKKMKNYESTLVKNNLRKKGFTSSMARLGAQTTGYKMGKDRSRPGCCPMCPNLEHMVHGSMEPFGGIFGNGELGGDMTEKMKAQHSLDRSDMDPALDPAGGGMAAGAAMGAMSAFRL